MNLYEIKYQRHAYDKPHINKQAAMNMQEAKKKYQEEGLKPKDIISIRENNGLIG